MIIIIRKSLICFVIACLIGLSFIIFLPSFAFSPDLTLPRMPTILLDPGHGGWDGGTHDFNGLLEKNIVLDYAFLLKTELEKYNFQVQMTRTTDRELSEFAPYQGTRQRTDLLARVMMVTQYKANIMLSIHVNAAAKHDLCGAIAFYQRQSTDSKKLAKSIQNSIQKLQTYNQQTILPANFYILNQSPITTVLLELAFITHPREHDDLQNPDYLKKMAELVALAVYQYTVDKHSKPTIFHYLF